MDARLRRFGIGDATDTTSVLNRRPATGRSRSSEPAPARHRRGCPVPELTATAMGTHRISQTSSCGVGDDDSFVAAALGIHDGFRVLGHRRRENESRQRSRSASAYLQSWAQQLSRS